MALDIKIVGGQVVDGTGAKPYGADVGIANGRVVQLGSITESAAQTLDAKGALVTPGFVDLHTHLDGQASWDSDLLPSVHHGVTTAVMGNCAVGFAPVRPQDRSTLIQLMEGVEDIPGSALAEGLSWDWESFPEYLEALDRLPHTLDLAAQVPHDALRLYVMGDRAVAQQAASVEDVSEMSRLLREALQAGAVGFSTGRTDLHRSVTGAATPASEASAQELNGLAQAFAGLSHGVIQAVSDFNLETSSEDFDREFDLLENMAAQTQGRPLSLTCVQRDFAPEQWRQILKRVEQAAARGLNLKVQVSPRPIGVLLGLQTTYHPLMGFPTYKKLAHLPLADRVRELRNPSAKKQLLQEKSESVAGDGSPVPPMVDKMMELLDFVSMKMFRLGDIPNYEPNPIDSLCAEALQKNISPLEALYDALLEKNGEQLIYLPFNNYTEMSLDNVHAMLTHPRALFGLTDSGAHVGTVCDVSSTTYLLMHWVRDRAQGKIPLERAVQMLTADAADHLGLADRGRILLGQKADLNIIDLSRLSLQSPHLVRDLPAGGQRFLQAAEGYVATLVSGRIVAQGGQLSGQMPGRVVRGR